MSEPLIDQWTAALHEEFTDHKDPKSGLSRDCERCRAMAIKLFDLQTEKLVEVALIEGEIDFGGTLRERGLVN